MNLTDYMRSMVGMRLSMNQPPPDEYNYLCIEDFVLDRATVFESAPLTEREQRILMRAIRASRLPDFRLKECFYNAQMVVLSDPSATLEYAEGMAVGAAAFPVHHGWIVLNGKVIDLTWRTEDPNHGGDYPDRIFGTFPDGWAYHGALIDRETCRRKVVETEMVGTMIDDWEQGHPLFKLERKSPRQYNEFPKVG